MIDYDGLPFAFDPATSHLWLAVNRGKDGKPGYVWGIDGHLCAVDEPFPRGDFAGKRRVRISASCTVPGGLQWQDLAGQVTESSRESRMWNAILLVGEGDDPANPSPLGDDANMSVQHRIALLRRRGYHFSIEAEAVFVPRAMAAELMFGGASHTPEQREAAAEHLSILDELPLARIQVSVPHNVRDQIAYARNTATRLGLGDLEPWPGRGLHHLALGAERLGRDDTDAHATLIPPWADDSLD